MGLIAVFAIYAICYMSVLCGIMGANTERMVFLVLNVGVKLLFSIAFVVIRGTEYHSTLTGVLKKLSTSNVAIVSILRGSFDILLPCVGDGEGHCQLTQGNAGDMLQLEHALQRKVAGQSLGDLLADDSERARFEAYVRNAQRQSEVPQAISSNGSQPDWSLNVGGSLPPVAQVLNCRLGFGDPAPGGRMQTLGCAVHLSVVPGSVHFGPGRQMVAAVRFTEESEAGRPEEATAAPDFQSFEPGTESDTAEYPCSSEMSSEKKSSSNNDNMVASLTDVAKLGMSALLQTAGSVSADGEGTESGYGESCLNGKSSFVKPKQSIERRSASGKKSIERRSTGTFSELGGGVASVISEDDWEDSASVMKFHTMKQPEVPQIHVVEAPKEPEAAELNSPRGAGAPSTVGSSVSRSGAFQRLSTLLEPEEERFSRSTTDEQKVAAYTDPMPDELSKDNSPDTDKKAAFTSISAAVNAVTQELLMKDAEAKATNATVTVTMRIAPLQFGLAMGTVGLAACATMFSFRRR